MWIIPRCHQYNDLLSSKDGHTKLKRVLKAWVTSHPQFVYWQGLDSLCLPLSFLNFNDEATAYACFSTFIPKYLHNFFLRDNSAVVREYLSKFSHLIAFHDAELANHMSEINFIPELFAIPWFLTMFSHVLPLHKIFHLWDKLLLGDASFPLFIGVSILKQLRETLLSSGFNECILLFSDLPEVDIEQSVTDSIDIYCVTPRSITFRMHESESTLLEGALLQRHNQALSEFCSSLSSTDLLDLINTRFKKPKVLVIDIRDNEEYVAESIIGSINIPLARIPDLESTDLGSMESSPEMNILFNNKGSIIVIVGGEDSMRQAKFARFIVRLGFPKVTYVHEHVNSFECYGVLGPGIPS
ncbi:LOW QUALITY PROTEIN: TBC domain-containing protein kinase-like protein [Diaphorina citri]|uniref:LOW QUALITY PROTEIN: TBC domain-containing protein kinase-like protein n=1 Tax=Diaphorina citri TaxID=121845 RepID=A0A3Q0JMG7_DIACI|nr:LOW QUALITY PROTEIN: TBC domain-containing protein kinase-like protein [Diaphorina citri]